MSGWPPDRRIEKQWVGRSFGAAARSYDGAAALQRTVGQALLSRWADRLRHPETLLDAGAGTGHFAVELRNRYPDSRLCVLDLAEDMLRVAKARLGCSGNAWYVTGDAAGLPLSEATIDLVFSNLMIQWCPNLAAVFREFRRVLRPGGTVLFSTFGPATLPELRRAWAAVDAHSHVNDFAALDDIAAVLDAAGFARRILHREIRSPEYRDVDSLMRELKQLGARNLTSGRPRHLTGKRAMQKMREAYDARTEAGGIRASFEMIYGYASLDPADP